jgi:DNA-binding response OmpR family regulator
MQPKTAYVGGIWMQENKKRILIVDDEVKIVEVIKSYLEKSNYETYEAYDGKQALTIYETKRPDLIILDLMLPDISGEEICERIRNTTSRVPIIMLTAKIEEEDVLKGLNIGADDYMSKPFSPRQLLARINAVLRRTSNEELLLANILSYNNGDLIIDFEKREVKKNGVPVKLTPSEYDILHVLIKHSQKTFSREELINIVLGMEFDGYDRTIDTHIKNLRKKIEVGNNGFKYVITIHGIGYKFGGE